MPPLLCPALQYRVHSESSSLACQLALCHLRVTRRRTKGKRWGEGTWSFLLESIPVSITLAMALDLGSNNQLQWTSFLFPASFSRPTTSFTASLGDSSTFHMGQGPEMPLPANQCPLPRNQQPISTLSLEV